MSSNQLERVDEAEPTRLDVVYDPLDYPVMVSWFNPQGTDEEWIRIEADSLVDLKGAL